MQLPPSRRVIVRLMTIRRVLISVTDKTGIVDFARAPERTRRGNYLHRRHRAHDSRTGVPVRDVSEVTGFPEMLDGRVKTMHPKITGGILAMRGRAEHMAALAEHGIPPIDMVVVNLYRFEKVAAKAGARLEELIENIDIGGPTMIRSAAKNYQDVAVVVSPDDYAAIVDELRARRRCRSRRSGGWRKKAFRTTADYDRAISARLAPGRRRRRGGLPAELQSARPS